jgi:hypothetical protein
LALRHRQGYTEMPVPPCRRQKLLHIALQDEDACNPLELHQQIK